MVLFEDDMLTNVSINGYFEVYTTNGTKKHADYKHDIVCVLVLPSWKS
jgi:hypothetical protein